MENNQQIYDLIILGGGCAGLTAGIYAGRAKLKTLIIEKQQVGGQATTTDEIANYPGIKSVKGPELMNTMLEQAKSFGSEFIITDVISADLKSEIKEVKTHSETYKSRAIILASGANPKKLGFEGEDTFTGRGVSYCATCDGFFFTNKDIFVIGGGYSAAEEALYLTRFGKKVTILVRKDKFRCAQSIVDKLLANPKIEVRFNTEVVKVYGDQMMEGATLKNNITGETSEYKAPADAGMFGLFVFIGYNPTSELFKDQVNLDDNGYIITNEKMETNISGVFAAGDITPKMLRQLVTATADGAVAATEAEKYITEFKEKHNIKDEEPQQTESNTNADNNTSSEKEAEKTEEAGGIFSPELKNQMLSFFENLERETTIVSIIEENSEKSKEMEEFLKEVCELSSLLKLEIYKKGENAQLEKELNIEHTPAIALLDHNKKYSGIKFYGVPGGHEFNSFIFALYNLSGKGQDIEQSLLDRINSINTPTHIQVAISLSCHFCPEVVIASQRLATLNSNIEAEMLDVTLYPEIQKKYNIMSVPAIIVNNDKITFGAQSLDKILDLITQN